MKELWEFAGDDLALVRLVQLVAFATDAGRAREAEMMNPSEEDEEWAMALSAPAKAAALRDVVSQFRAWIEEGSVTLAPPQLADVHDLSDLAQTILAFLHNANPAIDDDREVRIVLDVVTGTEWPKGLEWIDRYGALSTGTLGIADWATASELEQLAKLHKRSRKRIQKDAMPPGAQVGFGAFIAASWLVAPGVAEAIGTAFGTHVLGYSGAAATSAGLAALGGGSLASGGFGMAGGALFVGLAAKGAARAGASALGGVIARQSAGAFINELAKIDVRVQLDPSLAEQVLPQLEALHSSLRDEWQSIKPDSGARRRQIAKHLQKIVEDPAGVLEHSKKAVGELPGKEERNLATAVRSVEFELRHLQSPEWKRRAAMVPRMFGMPSLSKVIDAFEE